MASTRATSAARRQVEPRNGVEQRGGDGVGGRFGRARPLQRLHPPLHPDLAERRLGDDFGHAGDLPREGVERLNVRPRGLGNEQAREPCVAIRLAASTKRRLARGVIAGQRRADARGHGAASRSAATGRPSPSRML